MTDANNMEILEEIDFGSGIAEYDTHLEHYFVRTPAFRDVVRDEYDVVLGAKGTGKTAMFKMLCSENYEIKELADVDVISAFGTQGSSLFSRLDGETDEYTLRRVWTAYIISLSGNHLLDVYSGIHEIDPMVSEELKRAGLRMAYGEPRGIWRRIVDALTLVTPEATLGMDANGLPTLTGKVTRNVDSHTESSHPFNWLEPESELEPLIALIEDAYRKIGRRCWVVLDRLDEAFADRPLLERAALRGLLRTYLDLNNFGPYLKAKIFLRSDIFDRITEDGGFTNASHVNPLTLRWLRQDVEKVILGRLDACGPLREAVLKKSMEDSAGRGKSWKSLMFEYCFSGSIRQFTGKRFDSKPSIVWCIENTSSAPKEPSPRNVLRLLREAQRIAQGRWADEYAGHLQLPLIHGADLQAAWLEVSKLRLEDTIYSEFNDLKQYIVLFRNENQIADIRNLAGRFNQDPSGREFGRLIEKLEYCGFLSRRSASIFVVNPLYLPALEIKPGSGGLGLASNRSPEVESVDLANSAEEALARVRSLLESADIEGAISFSESQKDISLGVARELANAAVETRAEEYVRRVARMLTEEPLRSSMFGTRLALMYAAGDNEAVVGIFDEMSGKLEWGHVIRQFISLLSHDPELEKSVWKHQLHHKGVKRRPDYWVKSVPILAGSRLLPVARGIGESSEDIDDSVSMVFRQWWPRDSWVYESHVRTMDGVLWRYSKDSKSTEPLLFPYQVVSLVRSRTLLGTVNMSMLDGVVKALVEDVRSLESRHVSQFSAWAHFDPFARRVVDEAGISYL